MEPDTISSSITTSSALTRKPRARMGITIMAPRMSFRTLGRTLTAGTSARTCGCRAVAVRRPILARPAVLGFPSGPAPASPQPYKPLPPALPPPDTTCTATHETITGLTGSTPMSSLKMQQALFGLADQAALGVPPNEMGGAIIRHADGTYDFVPVPADPTKSSPCMYYPMGGYPNVTQRVTPRWRTCTPPAPNTRSRALSVGRSHSPPWRGRRIRTWSLANRSMRRELPTRRTSRIRLYPSRRREHECDPCVGLGRLPRRLA